MSTYNPQDDDFQPLRRRGPEEPINRPSLSYWQDAWIRLRKNIRALISLGIIILLFLFTMFGPLLWPVNPALQDLNQISQAPSWPKSAIIAAPYTRWSQIRFEQTHSNSSTPSPLKLAPADLKIARAPTTQAVVLTWNKMTAVEGYNIYRNTHEPRDFNDLGLPLGSTLANELSYEDRLSLEPRKYYYSLVPTDGFDEYEVYSHITVTPTLVITMDKALERGLITDSDNVTIGDKISIEFHPFGTDYLGRDILARLIEGARVSLFIGIVAPFLFVVFGIIYGGFSGYFGGSVDSVLMRFAEFVVALPFLLFMILFKVAFGIGPGESGILPMLLALVLLSWPSTARLVRGQVLQIREEGYIQAAKLLGAKPQYLVFRHILPNTIGVILVTLTFAVPTAIFTEAFLSFIGMGVAPPTPSWGSMCNEGMKTMLSHPHELIFPALFISVTVLAFNLLGDGLTEALDAKTRSN
jgi:oligopeptide transport system permease protein